MRWLFFGAGCIEPAINERMFERPAPSSPMSLGYGSYDATLHGLEVAISPGPFVLGERFSAADVYLASQIGWGMQAKALEPRAAFQAYSARCSDRPAFQRFSAAAGKLG